MLRPFDERNAAEAAGVLIQAAGGCLTADRLSMLLYLADREAWHRHGRPITWDAAVSTPEGPRLRRVSQLARPGFKAPPGPWADAVGPGEDGRWIVARDLQVEVLSPAQQHLLEDIERRFSASPDEVLASQLRSLPEWDATAGVATPISVATILRAGGLGDHDIREHLAELEAEAAVVAVTSVR